MQQIRNPSKRYHTAAGKRERWAAIPFRFWQNISAFELLLPFLLASISGPTAASNVVSEWKPQSEKRFQFLAGSVPNDSASSSCCCCCRCEFWPQCHSAELSKLFVQRSYNKFVRYVFWQPFKNFNFNLNFNSN